jgi:hypothetical protein
MFRKACRRRAATNFDSRPGLSMPSVSAFATTGPASRRPHGDDSCAAAQRPRHEDRPWVQLSSRSTTTCHRHGLRLPPVPRPPLRRRSLQQAQIARPGTAALRRAARERRREPALRGASTALAGRRTARWAGAARSPSLPADTRARVGGRARECRRLVQDLWLLTPGTPRAGLLGLVYSGWSTRTGYSNGHRELERAEN